MSNVGGEYRNPGKRAHMHVMSSWHTKSYDLTCNLHGMHCPHAKIVSRVLPVHPIQRRRLRLACGFRGVHDLHCSIAQGLPLTTAGEPLRVRILPLLRDLRIYGRRILRTVVSTNHSLWLTNGRWGC